MTKTRQPISPSNELGRMAREKMTTAQGFKYRKRGLPGLEAMAKGTVLKEYK